MDDDVFDRGFSAVVAIPLFGQEIAPRFCFAPELLIVGLDAGIEVSRQRFSILDLPWPERMHVLERHGVNVLLCGGFNRRLLPTARGLGITVCWGFTGNAEDALVRLLENRKE